MPFMKIEEYKAPWETEAGEDAEIDKVRLKKYLHGLESDKVRAQESSAAAAKERDEAKTALAEKTRESESEADKRAREAAEGGKTTEELKAARIEVLKLQVALEKGLTETQAKRLVGDTKEALEVDADDLVKSFGGTGKVDDEEGEPAPRRQPQRQKNPGDPDPEADREINIDKALESIPRIN